MSEVTSPIAELEEVVKTTHSMWFNMDFQKSKGSHSFNASISIDAYGTSKPTFYIGYYDASLKSSMWQNSTPKTLVDAFAELANVYPSAKLDLDHVMVSMTKRSVTKLTPTKLKPLIVQAWYEASGQPIPTVDELKKAEKAAKLKKKAGDEAIVQGLRNGSGLKKFKRMTIPEKIALDFNKADLSDSQLAKIDFNYVDKMNDVNFEGADLTNANFNRVGLKNANFTNCKLLDSNFDTARCKGTKFINADLTKSSFYYADLHGADFTGAILADVKKWEYAKFDHETKWPKGFKIPMELEWKGIGPDPRLAPTKSEKKLPKPTDFPAFLDRLKNATDPAKLDKAMKMLKAERFNLFAKVTDSEMVGVVKSQSDPDLVYSCRLNSEGNYSCCTQNLNVCGGLRGSPCKHLLVLVVGLTKAGELDPATAHEWSQSTRGRKAELDKDAMTETLLQYKGAEAGEIDWRPTETLPEDFYSM